MGWLAGWRRLFVRLTCCQVVTMRMDGPGWRRRGGGKQTAELPAEGGEQEALEKRWINPDEGDDIAASKFLCGGQVVAA